MTTKSPSHEQDAAALTALGRTLHGDTWLPSLSTTLGYSPAHVGQVAVGSAPMTPRLRMRLARVVADAVRSEPDVVAERSRALAHAAARFQH